LLSVPSFLAAYRQLDDGRHRAEFYRMWRAADAAADPALSAFVDRMNEHQLVAGSLAETFSSAPHMTADLIGALAIADGTGDFSTTLRRLAELYEDGFR